MFTLFYVQYICLNIITPEFGLETYNRYRAPESDRTRTLALQLGRGSRIRYRGKNEN